MKWIMDLYREFTSFEGSLFKYSLSFSLLLALAPSLLLIAMLFRFAYLPMDIIMKFLISFMPDWIRYFSSSQIRITTSPPLL